jgi:hypothetical protein
MGLLKHLLFWPVTGPRFLIDFSLGTVHDVVRDELTDDTPIKGELLELQMLLELGDIDDDEYLRREAEIMARLRSVREWRERFGMGIAGGPVRVQGAGEADADTGPDAAEPAARVADPGGAVIDLGIDLDFDAGGDDDGDDPGDDGSGAAGAP